MIARRRRGFTLIELLVYMSLVTMGLLLIGTVELAAYRTVSMQQALIAIEMQAQELLGRFRRDVEAARRVEATGDGELLVERLDGRRVRYAGGERVAEGGEAPPRRDAYPAVAAWEVAVTRVVAPSGREVPQVRVEVTFAVSTREGEVRRVRRRSALARVEVGRAE